MTDLPERSWTWLDGLLLVLAPVSQVSLLAGAFAWGRGWLSFLLWVILSWLTVGGQALMVAGAVGLLIWQRQTTVPPSPPRNFAVSFLIFAVALCWFLPWRGVFAWVQTQGRHQMEASLPLSALVEDCRSLMGQFADALPETGEPVEVPRPFLPAIAQLNPTSVTVGLDGVRIEQAGGFLHYGYRYSQTPDGFQWALIWYTEGEIEELLASPNEF